MRSTKRCSYPVGPRHRSSNIQAVALKAIEENYEHEIDWLRCWLADGKFPGSRWP